ncbi:MAG: LysM peptidoglycan-binding domain-containing protein [Kiritimatiellae bacterium]|nr:LysM peptidoglycan-binding domain-containing protein [Kiritimatiellia bacterium]
MRKLSAKELWVLGVFAGLHAVAVAAIVLSQGCGTPRPTAVEPPPAPVMPPPAVPEPPPAVLPPPAPVPPPAQRPSPPPSADLAPKEYVVQPGDSLSKIAARHGVSTRELAELNAITDPNKLRAGQKLLLPGHASRPRPEKPASARAAAAADEYVVQPGDSLSKIAARHGVSARELAELNAITDPNKLRAGQKLKLPAAAKTSESRPARPMEKPVAPPPAPVPPSVTVPTPAPAPAPEPSPQLTPPPPTAPAPPASPSPAAPTPTLGASAQPIRYPVSAGETLESIAKIFLVTPESILKLNNLPDASAVKPGMTLLIPISQ